MRGVRIPDRQRVEACKPLQPLGELLALRDVRAVGEDGQDLAFGRGGRGSFQPDKIAVCENSGAGAVLALPAPIPGSS